MKASTWIAIILAVVAVVLAVMWISANNQKAQLIRQKDSLRASVEQATQTINDIQGNLDSIENGLSAELIPNSEMPGGNSKDKIINTIASMKRQIQQDKSRIAELEKQLSGSKTQIKGVQELINKLKASIADKEKIVAELTGKLGEANATLEQERALSKEEIAKREKDIAERQATIEAQQKDANTVYYVYGTRKDLIAKGIISRTGGLLGIGKVSTIQRNADLQKYTAINLLEDTHITFPQTKNGYSILSNQPASSYQVQKSGKSYTLNVTNPEQFRRIKLVVIEIL